MTFLIEFAIHTSEKSRTFAEKEQRQSSLRIFINWICRRLFEETEKNILEMR